MNPLWLLPSLVLGCFYAVTSGNWLMLAATVLMSVVSLAVSRKRSVPEGNLEVTAKTVFLGGKKLPKWNFFWTRSLNQAVMDAINNLPTPNVATHSINWCEGDPDSIAIGLTARLSLSRGGGHLLVLGPTGSGKSELIHLVLASVSDAVNVLIADYKGGAVLTERPDLRGISDLDPETQQKKFWALIHRELSIREQELKQRGVASIEHANRLGQDFPRLLIIVDEVVAAIRTCPSSQATLVAVATRGRSLGVHLLVTSQSLVGIPRELLINLKSRLALAGTDEVELLQLGFKEKFKASSSNTKAALFSQDGLVESVEVPLGIRRAPRTVG